MNTEYAVKDVDGTLHAYHLRIPEEGGGKRFLFLTPDRKPSDGDIKTPDLPLYASERAGQAKTLFVTEGEKACDALLALGIPAVATVTGARSCPKPEAIANLARGRNFIIWPDNDEGGRIHAQNVAHALTKAGASNVLVIDYQPITLRSIHMPPHGDAYDFVAAFPDPEDAKVFVRELVDGWAVAPTPAPAKPLTIHIPAGGRDDLTNFSVSAALIERYGLRAVPGKNTRCPMHDDRNASLSVLKDDLRAICHSPTCTWSERGVIAVDVYTATQP
jgi:hypothetical protein